MLPIEKNARRLVGVAAQHFPAGATSDELRLQFEKDIALARPAFYEALRYAKEQRWLVLRLENDRLEYLVDLQAVPIEKLPDEVECLSDWSSGSTANGVAVSNLAQIVGDSTANTRQRLRAAATVLGYKVEDAGVLELTRDFLESICANAEIATDDRIKAGELLRRQEAPRIMPSIERPPARVDPAQEPPEPLAELLAKRKARQDRLQREQTAKLEREMGLRPAAAADMSNPDDDLDPAQTAG